jgi:Putative transposase DNA-binding domain
MMGRKQNARISGAVRSEVFSALTHLAAKVGIAVVLVPARGTSQGCPRCTRVLRHVASSDRLQSPGRGRWAYCQHCHLSMDRDHAGAQRIAGRGLSSQAGTYRDRSKKAVIRTSVDVPISRCLRRREKHHPTPTRQFVRQSIARPLRPSNPTLAMQIAGQRPVGQVPEAIRASGGQALSAFDYSRSHQPRWAGLGFGFHRSVQGSLVLPRGNWGPKEERLHQNAEFYS